MVSFLSVEAFRERLREVCEPELSFAESFSYGTGLDLFEKGKPFRGTIEEDSFILKSNNKFFPTSSCIKGTYTKHFSITTVEHRMVVRVWPYLFFRFGWVFPTVVLAIFFISHEIYDTRLLVTFGGFIAIFALVSISNDMYRAKQMEREYIDLMDIAPNSKEE